MYSLNYILFLIQDLYVYVFDDNELDITSQIGRAAIPLQPLLQNKPVKGIFELEKVIILLFVYYFCAIL